MARLKTINGYTRSEIAAAFIRDRAEQYDSSSGIYDALCTLAARFDDREHMAAFLHGELDELLEQMRKFRAKKKRPGQRRGSRNEPTVRIELSYDSLSVAEQAYDLAMRDNNHTATDIFELENALANAATVIRELERKRNDSMTEAASGILRDYQIEGDDSVRDIVERLSATATKQAAEIERLRKAQGDVAALRDAERERDAARAELVETRSKLLDVLDVSVDSSRPLSALVDDVILDLNCEYERAGDPGDPSNGELRAELARMRAERDAAAERCPGCGRGPNDEDGPCPLVDGAVEREKGGEQCETGCNAQTLEKRAAELEADAREAMTDARAAATGTRPAHSRKRRDCGDVRVSSARKEAGDGSRAT